MEERRTYSVLDFVRSQKSSDLCRFIFCARITSPDELLRLFARCRNESSASSVTGLLLVYQRYVVHLLEAPEDETFEMCSRFVDAEPSCLGDSKCFPTQANVDERFFDKWRARKIAGDCETVEKYDDEVVESFEAAKDIYCKLFEDLHGFCDELRASRTTSRVSAGNNKRAKGASNFMIIIDSLFPY